MTDDTSGGALAVEPPNASTRLAFDRTFLAHERTQMAWVRTSLSLISFGFGIAKFYQYLHESQGQQAPIFGARGVGMLMISIGLLSLVLANLQHRHMLGALRNEYPNLPQSTAGALSAVIMLLGILAFAATFL